MTKIKLHLAILISLIVLGGCTSTKEIVSNTWAGKPIQVDGAADEWHASLFSFSTSAQLKYAFSNDETNLYLCVVAINRQSQSKLMMSGLQVSIDTVGGKKKHVTVLYPIPPDKAVERRAGGPPILNTQDVMLSGFKFSPEQKQFLVGEAHGFTAHVAWDNQQQLVWEASIPIREFMTNTKAGIISLQLTLKGMSMPQGIGMSPPAGGGRPPGGGPGMGPGSGPPGGAPPSGGGDMTAMTQDQHVRSVFKLARKEL